MDWVIILDAAIVIIAVILGINLLYIVATYVAEKVGDMHWRATQYDLLHEELWQARQELFALLNETRKSL